MVERRSKGKVGVVEQPPSKELLTKEHKAAMAEHAYLQLSPQIPMGHVSSFQLQAWREALGGGLQSPDRMIHLASLDIETASALFRELNKGRQKRIPRLEVVHYLDRAKKTLQDLEKTPKLSPLTKLRAGLMESGVDIYKELIGRNDDTAYNKANQNYLKQLGGIAQKAVDYVKYAKGEHDDSFMQAFTTLFVLNDETAYRALPATSRFWASKVDKQNQKHLYVIDAAAGVGFTLRVAAEGGNDTMRIDPSALLQDGFAAKHPYGTLAAEISMHKELMALLEARGKGIDGKLQKKLDKSGEAADAHVQQVATNIKAALDQQLVDEANRRVNLDGNFQSALDAVRWYRKGVAYHQFDAFFPELQSAVALVEAENNREPIVSYGLAWMHVELGMKKAEADNRDTAAVIAHFERADTLFEEYENNTDDRAAMYQTQLNRLSLPIYRAIALQDPNIDSIRKEYYESLAVLAQGIMVEKPTTTPKVARDLTEMLHGITGLLLVATDERKAHIAAPSVWRQSDVWDTTVWSLTPYGFASNYFGRITAGQAEDNKQSEYSIDSEHLTEEVLDGLIAEIFDRKDKPAVVVQRRELIANARVSVLAVADSFEDHSVGL